MKSCSLKRIFRPLKCSCFVAIYDKFGFRWLSAFTKQLSSNIFLCKNNKPPSVLVPLYYAYANFSFICALYELHTCETKEIHIQTLTTGWRFNSAPAPLEFRSLQARRCSRRHLPLNDWQWMSMKFLSWRHFQ